MSTAFDQLQQRIRALPERQRRAGQVVRLKRYTQDVRKVAEEFRASVAVQSELRVAFPAASLRAVDTATEQGERLAVRLKGLVAGNPYAVDTPQAEELIIKLKAQAQAARAGVREEWRAQLQVVIDRYGKLIAAANKSQIGGAEQLARAMTHLQRHASIDPTPTQVVVMGRDLEALTRAVRELKLEGKGGRFLEQVLDGCGDPRDLADQEVRDFLDAHELWSDIVVVFR
jgi:hypothetical protein